MILFKPFDNIDACFMGRDMEPLTQQGLAISDLFLLKQVHGDRILSLGPDNSIAKNRMAEADGVICAISGVSIAIKTADCVPILMAHPQGVVAAVHAGWRGTDQRILTRALEILKTEFKLSPSELKIAIGPAISQESYQVDSAVAQRFSDGSFEGVVRPQGEKFLLDLKRANLQLALGAGVPIQNIEVHPECTYQKTEFYSYRRSQKEGAPTEGRNYSWIRLLK